MEKETKILNKITAIPIRSYSDNVELLFFGRSENHEIVELTNIDSYESNFYNIAELKVNDSHGWGVSSFLLKDIQPGCYSVCTWNSERTEQSIDIEFTVLGETNREYLGKMVEIIGGKGEPYFSIVENMSNNEPHFYNTLVTSEYINHLDSDNEDDIYKRFCVIKAVLDGTNLAINKSIGTKSISLNYCAGEITCNSSVEKLIDINITKLGNNSKQMHYLLPLNNYMIKLDYLPDTLHLYIALDRKNSPIGLMLNFVPSQNILAREWQKESTVCNEYAKALERSITYPSSQFFFTEKEREMVALIKKIEPQYPLFKSPRAEFKKGIVTINISHGYDLMNALDRDFYISFREPELALDPTQWRRIKITNKKMNFYAQEICIVDETYLVWIEDKDGNVISTVRILNLKESLAADDDEYYEYYDEDSFEEKLRLLELYEYNQHMSKYINIMCPEHKEVIEKVYSLAEEDHDTGKVDISSVLTDGLCLSKLAFNFARMAKALYEDATIYNKNNENLFHDNLKFYYKERKVAIPPEDDLLYIIDTYYVDRYMKREYINSPKKLVNTYHTFSGADFGVVYAINKNTLQRSGFILIDFYNNKTRPKLYKYMISAIEVVY